MGSRLPARLEAMVLTSRLRIHTRERIRTTTRHRGIKRQSVIAPSTLSAE